MILKGWRARGQLPEVNGKKIEGDEKESIEGSLPRLHGRTRQNSALDTQLTAARMKDLKQAY